MLSKEILEQLEECKDAKEIQTLAKANGFELTDEQAQAAYDAINGERELTEAELAQVAGGKGDDCSSHCRNEGVMTIPYGVIGR